MNKGKLIIEKLNSNLSRDEDFEFRKWFDESEINKLMYLRLKAIKQKGIDFEELMHIDESKAWEKVKPKLF